MLKVTAASAICALVEGMLPRGSGPENGLAIQLIAELEGKERNVKEVEPFHHTRRYISFVFVRANNYTKVFFNVSHGISPINRIKADDWELVSDHDSCWRDDGVGSKLADVYFEMAKEFKGAPIEQRDNSRFDAFSPKYCTVEVERTSDSNPRKFYKLNKVAWKAA